MSLKIIGAGLPRTGTTTLKRSLEILGYDKVYHMKVLLTNPDQYHLWDTLDKTNTTDWDTLYDGYQATVDFPCYPWYKEHMKRYPDAKVILTVRSFDGWYKSIYNTVWQAGPQTVPQKLVMLFKLLRSPRLRKVVKCIKLVKKKTYAQLLEGKFLDKANTERLFNEYIESVKAHVPAEKLLVYDVRDGWEPLCEFLGKPVPAEELPHLNKKENFKTMLKSLMKGEMV